MNSCIIFDLDGTLVDSREDLATGVNLMRKDFGYPPLSLETVVSYVGNGTPQLCQRVIKDTELTMEQALPVMKKHYQEHLLDTTYLYEGVAEGLKKLHNAGLPLAVMTNKPTEPSEKILTGLGVADYFRHIIGAGSKFKHKPDPEALNYVIQETDSVPAQSYMIGDNYTDLESGRHANMLRIFCTYGFGRQNGETFDFQAASFAELVDIILNGLSKAT